MTEDRLKLIMQYGGKKPSDIGAGHWAGLMAYYKKHLK